MSEKQYHVLIAHYRPDIVSGAENSIADFASQIDEKFKITMLVPGEGKLNSFYKKHGIETWKRTISTRRRIFPGLHEIQSLLFARELKKREFDAVICNTIAAASRISTSAKYARIPLAIYMRDYVRQSKSNFQIMNRADAIFAISQDVKNHLLKMLSPEKVFLTYNFINPEPVLSRKKAHQDSQKRLLPFPNCPVIGWVGRLTAYKQPEVFLRAIPLVLASLPEARFVIIGSAQSREKAYETQLRSLVSSLGIENEVVFLGQRNDAIEIASELSISCLTSRREPLGRVILEANLMRIPVIVPDAGGPAEIVDNEITGLHFSSEASDAEKQLANQIIRLLKDPASCDRLAENGYQKVMNTFASRKHITIQEDYIARLCSQQL